MLPSERNRTETMMLRTKQKGCCTPSKNSGKKREKQQPSQHASHHEYTESRPRTEHDARVHTTTLQMAFVTQQA